MRTEVIQIRVNPELKKKLQNMAVQDDRKLSDYIRIQLKRLTESNK